MKRSQGSVISAATGILSRQMERNRTRMRRADFVLTAGAICWLLVRFILFAVSSQR